MKKETAKQGIILIKIVLILGIISISIPSFAQIDAGYSMYQFNPQVISPSYVGSTSGSSVTLINRHQWQGIPGSPLTYTLSANIKKGKNKGIGLNVMYDQAGPMKLTTISADYAYHATLSNQWILSGGIRAGFANLSLNFDDAGLIHSGDPNFINHSTSRFNTGWGIKIAKSDGLYLSISQPRVLKYEIGTDIYDVPYIYGMVGTKISVLPNVKLFPSTLLRMASNLPISWDANLMFNFSNKLDLGINYRHQDSWGIRTGIFAFERVYIGFVYEIPTSAINKLNTPTNEIALRYSFSNKF